MSRIWKIIDGSIIIHHLQYFPITRRIARSPVGEGERAAISPAPLS